MTPQALAHLMASMNLNLRSYNSGLSPKQFGMSYRPNQQKRRKAFRQQPHGKS